jgi:hypothetical protein
VELKKEEAKEPDRHSSISLNQQQTSRQNSDNATKIKHNSLRYNCLLNKVNMASLGNLQTSLLSSTER